MAAGIYNQGTICIRPSVSFPSALSKVNTGQTINEVIKVTNATSAFASGLPAGLQVTANNVGPHLDLTVSGSTTANGSYSILVNATNATRDCTRFFGSGSYTSSKKLSMTVGAATCPKPTVGEISPELSFTHTKSFSGTITINNATTAALTGLPTGITIQSQNASGSNYVFTIGGTPTIGNQSYDIKVSATNLITGCATTYLVGLAKSLESPINAGKVLPLPCPAPVIPMLTTNIFTKNIRFSETIVISNAYNATVAGLPSGVIVRDGKVSGSNYVLEIAGTPTRENQNYSITVSAFNYNPNFSSSTCTMSKTETVIGAGVILPAQATAPIIGKITKNSLVQSDKSSIFQKNVPYKGTITIDNVIDPTRVTITGLPTGLVLKPSTLVAPTSGNGKAIFSVEGTPTGVTNESYDIRVTATNTFPSNAPSTTTSGSAGSGKVSPPDCVASSVGTASFSGFVQGKPYSSSISLLNTTNAEVVASTLPRGISAKVVKVTQSSVRIELTGTPTQKGQRYDIKIEAWTVSPVCYIVKSTVNAGKGTVG